MQPIPKESQIMNENRQKIKYIALWCILGLEIMKILYHVFELHLPVIGPICIMIDDARLFFSIVMLVVLFYLIKNKEEQRTGYILLGLLDIALIFQLYSDSVWRAYKKIVISKLITINLQMLIFLLLVVALILFSCYMFVHSRKKRKNGIGEDAFTSKSGLERNAYTNGDSSSFDRNDCFQTENQCHGSTRDKAENKDNSFNLNTEPMNIRNDTVNADDNKRKQGKTLEIFLFSALFFVCLAVIEWCITTKVEKVNLPEWWQQIQLGLFILFILCSSSVVLCIIIGLWRNKYESTQKWNWILNVLTFGLSIALLYGIYTKNDFGNTLLDNFLTGVTNNSIIAFLIIPFVIFMMLKIFLMLLVKILFPGLIDMESTRQIEKGMQKIEAGIISLILNLYAGIVNLFLFIPDFLNEICEVLLDSDDLFPHSRIKFDKEKEDDPEEKK